MFWYLQTANHRLLFHSKGANEDVLIRLFDHWNWNFNVGCLLDNSCYGVSLTWCLVVIVFHEHLSTLVMFRSNNFRIRRRFGWGAPRGGRCLHLPCPRARVRFKRPKSVRRCQCFWFYLFWFFKWQYSKGHTLALLWSRNNRAPLWRYIKFSCHSSCDRLWRKSRSEKEEKRTTRTGRQWWCWGILFIACSWFSSKY